MTRARTVRPPSDVVVVTRRLHRRDGRRCTAAVGLLALLAALGVALVGSPAPAAAQTAPPQVTTAVVTSATSSSSSSTTSTSSTTEPAEVAPEAVNPPAATPKATADPPGVWFWNRLLPVLVSSILAAGLALSLAYLGDKRTTARWTDDRDIARRVRKADRIEEAVMEVSRVAQDWRSAILRRSAEARPVRENWRHWIDSVERLERELVEADREGAEQARLDSDYFERHGAHDQGLRIGAKNAQDRVTELAAKIEDARMRVSAFESQVRDVIYTDDRDLQSRWIHARGQIEIMAPELLDPVGRVQTALQSWQGREVQLEGSRGEDMSRHDVAYAKLTGAAAEVISGLDDDPSRKDPSSLPVADVIKAVRDAERN